MLPSEVGRSLDWMARSACQREDPELFFPITVSGAGAHQVNEAKEVCQRCSVRAACLSFGLQTKQDGIWGGTTNDERSAIRGAQRRDAARLRSHTPGHQIHLTATNEITLRSDERMTGGSLSVNRASTAGC